MSDGVYSKRKNVVANDTKSAKKIKPQIEAQRKRVQFGKEEQGSVRMTSFSAVGIKRRRSKADFAPTSWCERWDLNPHACK